jgi:hypothetical protein
MPRVVLFDKKGQQQQDQPVDLIHTRANVLQRLPPDHALNFLCNVLTSKARFFVTTTTFPMVAAPGKKNRNLREGTFYQHNDLSAHPFHLPSPSDDVVSCEKTHHERGETETCVYDLTKPWVKEWTKAKNCPVIVQVA